MVIRVRVARMLLCCALLASLAAGHSTRLRRALAESSSDDASGDAHDQESPGTEGNGYDAVLASTNVQASGTDIERQGEVLAQLVDYGVSAAADSGSQRTDSTPEVAPDSIPDDGVGGSDDEVIVVAQSAYTTSASGFGEDVNTAYAIPPSNTGSVGDYIDADAYAVEDVTLPFQNLNQLSSDGSSAYSAPSLAYIGDDYGSHANADAGGNDYASNDYASNDYASNDYGSHANMASSLGSHANAPDVGDISTAPEGNDNDGHAIAPAAGDESTAPEGNDNDGHASARDVDVGVGSNDSDEPVASPST